MKSIRFTLINGLIILSCIAFSACKKAPDTQVDTAKSADAAKPADSAKTAEAKCGKWAKLPLFSDGQVLHFSYNLSLFSDNKEREGAAGWKCSDGECTLEIGSKLDCTVKLILNEADYCASKVSCTAKDGTYYPDMLPNGIWAVDRNGVHFSSDSSSLVRKAAPGCDDCEEGTLEYDYENMDDAEGWIVSFKYAVESKSDGGDEEDGGCDEGCKYSGTTYSCCTTDASGYEFIWDDLRGMVEYGGFAYGEKDGEMGEVEIKAE